MSAPDRRYRRSTAGTLVVFAVAMLAFVAVLGALIAATATRSGEQLGLDAAARVRQGDVEFSVWSVLDRADVNRPLSRDDIQALDQVVPISFGARASVIGATLSDIDGNIQWSWGDDIGAPHADGRIATASLDDQGDVSALHYTLPLRSVLSDEPVAVLTVLVVDPDVVETAGGLSLRVVIVVAAAMVALWLAAMALTLRLLRRSWRETENHRRVAMIDPLTGLANRSALNERGEAAIASALRHGDHTGLVVVDLNRFKAVNDIGGHALGDRVLVEVARRLLEVSRRGELAVRVGGDEFAVLVPTLRRRGDLEILASRIRAALEIPVRFAAADDVRVTASVGVAWAPEEGTSITDLFHTADASMYAEKHRVRGPLNASIERAKARQQASASAESDAGTENAAPRRRRPSAPVAPVEPADHSA